MPLQTTGLHGAFERTGVLVDNAGLDVVEAVLAAVGQLPLRCPCKFLGWGYCNIGLVL
jgi:hypothetical protein